MHPRCVRTALTIGGAFAIFMAARTLAAEPTPAALKSALQEAKFTLVATVTDTKRVATAFGLG